MPSHTVRKRPSLWRRLFLLELDRDRNWKNAGRPGPGDFGRRNGLTAVGKDEPADRPIAGRHPLSREIHHVLFSVGDFNCGECSAIGGVVSGGKDQALDF